MHCPRIRTDDLESRNPMNGMGHRLPEWLDLDGRLTRLQEVPIMLQFVFRWNLRPGLRTDAVPWAHCRPELDRVHGEDRRVLLVVRVKMWAMVRAALLNEHPDNNPEEARQFRHDFTLHRHIVGPVFVPSVISSGQRLGFSGGPMIIRPPPAASRVRLPFSVRNHSVFSSAILGR